MRSLKIATATALAGAALVLAGPSASASDTRCDPVTAAATEAESAYESARADYQKQIDAGGHPGKAEQDNVDQLRQKADSAASEAQRICGDSAMKPTAPASRKPSGAMHTGTGSTSDAGTSTPGLAAAGGLALAAAAGFVVRRRQSRRS
ncbi:LPXTG cell wall anchor domain-containing protein [Streptomyces sp. NPDC006296]|uniref:LPXTG cell wall anchor domain-containing protein n=1 Tax=Streptomyces sp. NPDC006296 TaxID=3156746 RepID=UPI0033AC3DCC